MARKKTPFPAASVTAGRARRLYRLVALLGQKAHTRTMLTRRLNVGVRGFYRDLETLRQAGIDVSLEKGKYQLGSKVDKVIARLPFPDPLLTLGEAEQLAKGRTKVHERLRQLVSEVTSATVGPKRKRGK